MIRNGKPFKRNQGYRGDNLIANPHESKDIEIIDRTKIQIRGRNCEIRKAYVYAVYTENGEALGQYYPEVKQSIDLADKILENRERLEEEDRKRRKNNGI